MKRICRLLCLSLAVSCGTLAAQTNQKGLLFIPYLDPTSQSNVVVTVCEPDKGQPCPTEFANVLSNTNLFTPKQRRWIQEALVKYIDVTTNRGPSGTVLTDLARTNYTVDARGRAVEVEDWIAHFQYTNGSGREEIRIGRSISAKFRTDAGEGCNVYLIRTGSGTMLRFTEIRNERVDGVMVEFNDCHPQGTNWSYHRADFGTGHLTGYRQYRNGMVLGKFLMWDPNNGNLLIAAEFKEPYDWSANYRPPGLKR